MQHWSVHLIFRVLAIIAVFSIALFMFSGDGSSDAMGNGMQSAFAMLLALTISVVGGLIFLGVESSRLLKKDGAADRSNTAKARANFALMAIMLLIPVMVILEL